MKAFFSEQYDDIYFNNDNPEAEKDFVFIQGNNLPLRLQHNADLVVAELGFGYGLNCALLLTAAREASFSGRLHFYSVEEKLPDFDAVSELLPKLTRSRQAYEALWQHRDTISRGETVTLFGAHVTVFPGQVNEFLASSGFLADAWFFDGFSPAKNPAMWSDAVFASAFARTREHGTFATYSSAGWVRRNLVAAGFAVKKVTGFAGKREMLIGIKEKDAPK
ncbi:MAG TPA: tRNA (5-methylaminomethyl-2-thiouridine)(34)-methyltransferase MnmD [Turneriella sp.]|nr:tRNA (5-methylaminomethyl-2-thiouridine)(34)-methyltransferase MnmD [Turneriella sp.]HMY11368.1 tRNA (5-methylaminomethyl-2-thiouridine)(34)-methyltransferase MnmD [Turneriella sp.]HNL09091.1 tRNA (5-methylaminomethyl-2-thiouridine)(34)-methyltransferase MnmD [Turneriella sp.]HNL53629.1 tRNA (5-methylaminomethyl-2-thiouridine)(34)-methyltransferase MnmD [Turneriella sp.]HNM98950.1 tRNA (5-methylaminomethyl-2-thiouridine)(34)-methyltransferase MnmD [Turneriella sp.]